MDSEVVHSRVHDAYGQDHGLQHGGDEHHHDNKSVLKKVKAKAKKIKNTITKHGHGHDHDHDHEYRYEGQHVPDDHDLDEEDDEDEDQEIHGAPIYESAAVRSKRPGQVENLGHSRVNVGGTTVMGQEHHHEPRVVVVSPVADSNLNSGIEPAGTFVGEDKTRQPKVNLDRPMGLDEDPQAPGSRAVAYDPPHYQSKVTDPTGAGTREIDTIPIEDSLARMNVHNEPKPNTVLPTGSGTRYPSAGSHDQFSLQPNPTSTNPTMFPEYPQVTTKTFGSGTQYPSAGSHGQFSPETTPTPTNATIFPEYPQATTRAFDANTKPANHSYYQTTEKPSSQSSYTSKPEYPQATTGTFGTITQPGERSYGEALEKPSTESSYTDKISSAASAVADKATSAKDAVASKLGYGEKGNRAENEMKHEHNMGVEKSSNQSSYTDKISSATSAIADKAVSAKDVVSSKLGYGEKGDRDESEMKHEEHNMGAEKPSTQTSYTNKISSATSAIADKAIFAKAVVASKLGYGEKGHRDKNEMKHEEHKMGAEKPSDQSSYTEKISSATSAIADKAISAKNVVASKLGYGEEGHRAENEMKYEEHKMEADKPSNQSSCTEKMLSAPSAIADKAVSATNVMSSKLGYGEKGDRDKKETTHVEHESRDTATKPGSTLDYGKKIASTMTEKLSPVYGAVAGAGSAVMSKLPGTGTGTNASTGSRNETENVVPKQDKGVSMKDYLAEKLRPGDEDRALSEVISEAYHMRKEYPMEGSGNVDRPVKEVVKDAIHKREEVPEKSEQKRPLGKVTESVEVRRYLGTDKDEKGSEESHVNSPGKGVVDKVKVAVGSLFGKTGDTPSSQEVRDGEQGTTEEKRNISGIN
ncbi:hypothetical protein L6164_006077 [Bauhinia variegata]|uniref:Uncharacterized protein n=1 Tax=Bauhinia variegata TaxID=167791 RepID=A0ACB9PYQ0_BAUVA|nr:hypothetical protein L6164_006077 [Bauhinia variegata]